MTQREKDLYFRARQAGCMPNQALYAARTIARFEPLDDDSVRIIAVPEEEPYFGVYGEPDGYRDLHGRYHTAEEERNEIEDVIERLGDYCVEAQVKCPKCGKWETVDSVGHCAGYERPCSPWENVYVPDLMQSALNELETAAA